MGEVRPVKPAWACWWTVCLLAIWTTGGGLCGREGGGELWGEDFGVKSKFGSLDWRVESEKVEDEGTDVLTREDGDEKVDLSVGGFGGGPCERRCGIH